MTSGGCGISSRRSIDILDIGILDIGILGIGILDIGIGWGGAIRNKNGVFSALFFITLKILKYETLSSLGNLVK